MLYLYLRQLFDLLINVNIYIIAFIIQRVHKNPKNFKFIMRDYEVGVLHFFRKKLLFSFVK